MGGQSGRREGEVIHTAAYLSTIVFAACGTTEKVGRGDVAGPEGLFPSKAKEWRLVQISSISRVLSSLLLGGRPDGERVLAQEFEVPWRDSGKGDIGRGKWRRGGDARCYYIVAIFFANPSISGLQITIEYTQLTLQMIFLRRHVGAPNI